MMVILMLVVVVVIVVYIYGINNCGDDIMQSLSYVIYLVSTGGTLIIWDRMFGKLHQESNIIIMSINLDFNNLKLSGMAFRHLSRGDFRRISLWFGSPSVKLEPTVDPGMFEHVKKEKIKNWAPNVFQ